ncbi:three-helix bundle dimerization domain-containing protein [Mycobacterium sp. 141]|uniref:three-helix bundle dimerization domain-containing protein n=1 Tax=Mycobacterium sp. 141 TaxID=1120797 RepID=UPI00035F5C36|nr:hypothetical protein [Mycobacterium sp. 141]
MSNVVEQIALAEVKRRLHQEFPGVAAADVDAAVSDAYARFDRRPIRDFVPLFVEKHARQRLAQHQMATSA